MMKKKKIYINVLKHLIQNTCNYTNRKIECQPCEKSLWNLQKIGQ